MMEVLQRTFCIETGKQNIKQLPEEPLSSVKLASERRQGNFFDTTEELKRDALVTASLTILSQHLHPKLT